MADLMDEAIEISHKLIPCNICGRTFLPSPLKKHAKVCEKNATRKRKTFNSLKQRIEGTELAVFHQKTFLRKSENLSVAAAAAPVAAHVHAPPPPPANEQKRNQSKWKEKHEQLVRAIRAAKGEKVMAPRRSISAVGSMGTTEQCPTCDRHFGPKAYDRHVEWCKEHKIRASKSPAVVTIAKERLEARTKYRVPPLNKSKRSVTREKYSSPSSNRNQEPTVMNVRSTSSLEQSTGHTRKTKHHHHQKAIPAQTCPPLAEPVIKHNSEKLKSSNFKYRVYPLQKMNDTDINESVLDMTVSHMNLCSGPAQSAIKLITWKDTQQQNEQILTANVSKNCCLPFTVNLVDSETKFQISNSDMNIIEYENNDSETVNGLGTIPEEASTTCDDDTITNKNVLPTILEETELPQLYTIQEAVSSAKICDDTDDEQLKTIERNEEILQENNNKENEETKVNEETEEAYSLEFLEEFRSSTPFNQTDSDSIQIRNETENSVSFDISPILKPILYETPVAVERKSSFTDTVEVIYKHDEKNAPKTPHSSTSETRRTRKIFTEDISEQEWQDLDEYEYEEPQYENITSKDEEEEDWTRNKSKKNYYDLNEQQYKKKRKHRKDAKILDKFLKEKKNNCRLEVEIIANESRAKKPTDTKNLNLYRVNSSEIVIRGDRCIDALNKSFLRNKIKHVNIVFINEDTKDESEITLQSDLNAKKYKDTFVINTDVPKKCAKLTGSKDRARHRRDNFWAQYTQNDYDDNFVTDDDADDGDDDSGHNLTLPPINIKKKNMHEQSYEYISPQRFNESPTRFPPIHEDKNQSSGKGTMKCENNKKHPLSPLKRSVSLSNPVVKARSMRNKQDIQDYLHVGGQKPSREKLKALSPRSSDELFPAGHDMYNEYKKYEEMYRREQDVENEQDDSSNEDCTPPLPERNYQIKMQAGDSAYGSLNRKTPQQSRQPKTQHVKQRSPSSSGSETCTSLPAKKSNRLTKFCHECGTKYPLDCAKFCVECGIKRLVL